MVTLSRSAWRRVLATLAAGLGFVLLFTVAIPDSRIVWLGGEGADDTPAAVVSLHAFEATAYCKGSETATGTRVHQRTAGLAAADQDLLPLGSIVMVTTNDLAYNGMYTILDTGPAVQGRLLDIYMWSCFDALDFGRQPVDVRILRLSWNPGNIEPDAIDAEFLEREAAMHARETSVPERPQTDVPAPPEVSLPDDRDTP